MAPLSSMLFCVHQIQIDVKIVTLYLICIIDFTSTFVIVEHQ